ncbi:unnamed protein product [Caenorhabditis auriculariae]|uniref:Uncharacterized protein n=1 Tax=Caenorhabditis auriculariae TaxID=2777116 RepID=A0A8S1GW79_9PELO|nr:unnamed protein product [Caenorhabditis auriculariae]
MKKPSHGMVKKIVLFAAPAVLSPLLFFGMPFRCVFVIGILSAYWIAEVLPLGVTSLIPLFLFPVLSVVASKKISVVYFKDSIVLFIATMIMALAVEATGLHRRVALKLLTKVGARKHTMLLGVMMTTSFISFFVSDTACTALMTPIVIAILTTLSEAKSSSSRTDRSSTTESSVSTMEEASNATSPTKKEFTSVAERLGMASMTKTDRGFCKAMILSCAHASLIGGTSIITSTGPNIVFREMLQTRYPHDEISVSYLQWMTFAMPPMFLYLLASYIILTVYFMGPRAISFWWSGDPEEDEKMKESMEEKIAFSYRELGPIKFGETSVACWFVILMLSWVFRSPGFMPGWTNLLPDNGKMLTDSVPGIFVATLMFIWPMDPFSDTPHEPILNWSHMQSKFSWSCTLLIAAGYAISEGVEASGLSKLMSCTMKKFFADLPAFPLLVAVTTTIVVMTEFASNVSTGSIFIPIALKVAESMRIHPLYLAFPTAVACSFAFMLPMSTPPNAIVYDTRAVSMMDMINTGLFLNICCIAITALNMSTWTYWVFDLGTFPASIHVNNTDWLTPRTYKLRVASSVPRHGDDDTDYDVEIGELPAEAYVRLL